MKIEPVSEQGIAEAISILQKGGTVAHATETCYGLACDLRDPKAVKKLFEIKARPEEQPVSALFASVDDAKKYVEWNDEAEKLAKQHLPGPLTLILRMKPDAPSQLHPTIEVLPTIHYSLQPSLGIRISSHPLAQRLVKEFGSPISTTSANIHGMPNPYSAENILAQFSGLEIIPDLILDSGILPKTPPSTVVDLTGNDKTVKRSGRVGV